MNKLTATVYEHLIRPIVESVAPVRHVSWGVAIGLFVGLTPTMGIQMYISAAIWTVCRYVFRFHFNLPISVAMVWVTNPVTVIPIYYVFLVTGSWILDIFGYEILPLSFQHFKTSFVAINEHESHWEVIVEGSRFLLIDLGWPMMLGGLCYAVPTAVVSYFVTKYALTRYREHKTVLVNVNYDK